MIGDDAAPRAERTIALWNPPLLDEELGIRASALGEASRLLAALVERGLRTLCFAKSRKAAELIHRFTADRLGAEYRDRLSPYRAGYTPAQRREIERRLVAGELLGVTATDALELGIDIGLLDCVISVGFPGTVASLRQQWGRAGRRGHGLAVLVASEDALDQYFMREPETLLGRRVEAAILDHANPRVLDGHVRAAAFEAPLDDGDRDVLGDEALERAAVLPGAATHAGRATSGRAATTRPHASRCARRARRRSPWSTPRPARSSDWSSASAPTRRSTTAPSTSTSASRTASPRSTSTPGRRSSSRSTATATRRRRRRRPPRSRSRSGSSRGSASSSSWGRVSVTEQVVAYQRKKASTQETLDLVALDLPGDDLRDRGDLVLPRGRKLEGIDRMPGCSAPCTRPSTR